MRGVALGVLAWAALLGSAEAQSYQQYCDGLIAVHAKKVVDERQQVAFDVCGELIRPADSCALDVSLSFRNSGGAVLAQVSPSLTPQYQQSSCQRVALPAKASAMRRWEISRFRCRSAVSQSPQGQTVLTSR